MPTFPPSTQSDARLARQRLAVSAVAFLQSYPIGTTVQGDEIVAWARDHADGLIASDLLISHSAFQLSALRRHLNTGGTRCGFFLEVVDNKRKIFVVRALVGERGATP
jgi:hypothetical protein